MADTSLPPPMLDPSQYPSYLDAQRKQQIAQMLLGAFQQSANSPNPTTGVSGAAGAVTPKRGLLQNVAPLVNALMARKALDSSNQANQQYMQGLYGGGQPQAPAPTGTGAGIISPDASPEAQAAAAAVTAMPPKSGLVQPQPAAQTQQPPRSNPLIPPGMTPSSAQQMLSLMGPETYAKTFLAPQYQTPEIVAQLRAAGIDPNGTQGRALQQQIIQKAANIPPTLVRPNETALDANSRTPFFTGPDNGIATTWSNGQPQVSVIPGATAAQTAIAKAKTTGTQTATPIKLGTDENGKDIYGYPAAPGTPGTPNATAPGSTASPADVEAQKKGAAAGVDFGTNLAANAAGATDLRRGLSELTNLAQQATPGAVNQRKLQGGAALIAMGADPGWVSKITGVDVGALQAAEHTSGGIAVSAIHQMTNRGTNFDMETFMKQNPNLNMADPAAFQRVVQYMDSKARDTIAQQKEFSQWVGQARKQGVSPQDYETQFTAHWLQKQNEAIDKGQTNSSRPGPTQHSLQELQAEARKRGLVIPP